jgi:hypothetical protein
VVVVVSSNDDQGWKNEYLWGGKRASKSGFRVLFMSLSLCCADASVVDRHDGRGNLHNTSSQGLAPELAWPLWG